MRLESACPKHIFDLPVDERIAYFAQEVIANHPELSRALDELDRKAYPMFERRLILLIGPTGVGKTALLRKLVRRRINKNAEAIRKNRELVPAFMVEVEAPDKGPFRFPTLYREALREMQAALPELSQPVVSHRSAPVYPLCIGAEAIRRRGDQDALKERFMTNLIDRKVEIASFDEAVNIFKVGRPRSQTERLQQLKDQADKLKTFTNKTPAAVILAGAYDFFELTLTSGQLARRSLIIHMEPYRMTESGLDGFLKALMGLISYLPSAHELDPAVHGTELFLQCLGCIGTVKNILTEGLSLAVKANRPLTIKLLRRAYFSAAQLKVMRQEMDDGALAVSELTSIAELADRAAQSADQRGHGQALRPGETKPSHRHDATKDW